MNGGAVTVNLPLIQTSEPRLYPDAHNQNNSDDTFEQKLQYEQARLGLLFSPFSQLEALFSASNLNLGSTNLEETLNSFLTTNPPRPELSRGANHLTTQPPNHLPRQVQMFESIPLRSFN